MSRQAEQLFQCLPVPAYLWDVASQKLVSTNQELRNLIGYTEEELLRLDWRDLVVPGEVATAERAVRDGPEMKGVRWHWCRKDGRVIAVIIASRKIVFVDDDTSIREVYMALVLSVDGQAVLPALEAFPE